MMDRRDLPPPGPSNVFCPTPYPCDPDGGRWCEIVLIALHAILVLATIGVTVWFALWG